MALKIYTYPHATAFPWPEDPNLPLLPVQGFGDRRFFEPVSTPENADFIVFPFVLDPIFYRLWRSVQFRDEDWSAVATWMQSLPFFREYESKHVFAIHYDHDVRFGFSSVFLRCSLSNVWHDERAFAIPFPHADLGSPVYDQPKFLTSFFGAAGTSVVRQVLLNSREQFAAIPHHIHANEHFFGGYGGDAGKKLREDYLRVLQQSITVLCPRGTGRNSIRFFEALCSGKIPVLLSDHAALPYEDVIDYSEIMIRVPEAEAHKTIVYIARFFQEKGSEGVVTACRRAREIWETYLRPEAQAEQYFRLLSGLR
jgi:hypothetical protein